MIKKLSIKDITDLISQNSNIPKKIIYNYCLKLKMKNRLILVFFIFLIFTGCVGTGSKGIFGTGVSLALDPRSLGTQIDDSVMQKNLSARLIIRNKVIYYL